MYFHNIIVTTDLSDVSNRAIEFLVKKIPNEVEKITLLTVISDWPLTGMPGEYVIDASTIETYNNNLHTLRLDELNTIAKKYFPNKPIQCKVISTPGSAAADICKYAQEVNSDLIVIGSHGAGFLENLLLGSTVQKVLKKAPCPVLVIPNISRG